MAKVDKNTGAYICGHCGSTDMRVERYVNKGNGVTRIVLTCNKCNGGDFYDSHDN